MTKKIKNLIIGLSSSLTAVLAVVGVLGAFVYIVKNVSHLLKMIK